MPKGDKQATELDEAVAALKELDQWNADDLKLPPGLTSTRVKGYVIQVLHNPGGTISLHVHENRDLLRWYRRAKALVKLVPGKGLVDAMDETRRSPEALSLKDAA
jgi:cytosine/adenosine deaminase-related metal-dependent hydrolase